MRDRQSFRDAVKAEMEQMRTGMEKWLAVWALNVIQEMEDRAKEVKDA